MQAPAWNGGNAEQSIELIECSTGRFAALWIKATAMELKVCSYSLHKGLHFRKSAIIIVALSPEQTRGKRPDARLRTRLRSEQ